MRYTVVNSIHPIYSTEYLSCISTTKYENQLVLRKYANFLDQALREDIERMKRVRLHRGLRHYWGIRVRGQHTKTTGRHRAFASADGKKK